MQVRNKLNGSVTSAPTNDNAIRALIRMGILEVVEDEPGDFVKMPNGQVIPKMKLAVEPRWYVGSIQVTSACDGFAQVDVGKRVPTIVYEGLNGNEKVQWAGSPKHGKQGFGGRVPPDDILKEYASAHAAYWKDR